MRILSGSLAGRSDSDSPSAWASKCRSIVTRSRSSSSTRRSRKRLSKRRSSSSWPEVAFSRICSAVLVGTNGAFRLSRDRRTNSTSARREFGWHAGGGVEVRAGRHFGIHADYRYTFLDFNDDDDEEIPGGGFVGRLLPGYKGSMWTVGATGVFLGATDYTDSTDRASEIGLACRNLLHRSRERVDLLDRRVDVRRDPHAFVFGMDDRRGDDSPAFPERGDDLRCRHARDLHGADGARLRRVEARLEPDFRVRPRAASPIDPAGSGAAPPCARCRFPRERSALRRSRCGWRPDGSRSPRTCGCRSPSRRRPA